MFDEPAFGPGALPDEDDPSLPLLHQIVYCSRAAEGVDAAGVDRIVATARRHNPERGITGLLVFGSGVFFQWIEGPRPEIERLLASIRRDQRHHDLVLLSETEEVRERLFPGWDMEQVDAHDIRDVLEDALETAEDPGNVVALERMLARLDGGPLQSLGRR
jgi:hypothetical protein